MIYQGVRLTFVSLVLLGTCLTNGSIAVLILRFHNLRTKPNFLILNSCVGDILGCFCTLPGFVAGYIFQDNTHFVGRAISLVISTFHVFFTLLNLLSLTILMIDRFCALKWSISYKMWRTASKVKLILAVTWSSCLVVSMLLIMPILDIDLGDMPSYIYRQKHFKVRGKYIAIIMFPLFIVNNTIVATMTCCTIKKSNLINTRTLRDQILSASELRRKNEVRAMQTIGITILLYFVCFLPSILYASLFEAYLSVHNTNWFGFFSLLAMYIPGFSNPIIFALRTKRFHRALRLLFEDPFGKSEYSYNGPC